MIGDLLKPQHLLIIVLSLFPVLLPAIFYLALLQKALRRCAPESRTMPPGQVLLLLIPLFNFVWHFIVVGRIASSLRNEFLRRQLPLDDPEPGKTLGIAMCVLSATCWIPILGVFTILAGFVCWILYWIRIAEYSGQIAFPA
jgi:hypothetical protein